MTILHEFQQALQIALDAYQAEKQSSEKGTSTRRIGDVIKFQEILAESNQVGKRSALLLRSSVSMFLGGLQVHPLARFIPALFGSQLYQKIHAVLEQPEYSEAVLIGRGLAENDEREERMLGYLKIGEMGKLIATIENLEAQLKTKEKTCADLTTQCQLLEKDKIQLATENQRLLAENQKLKAKLAQFENTPTEEKKEQKQSGIFSH